MKAQLIVLSMMSAYASAAAVTGCTTVVQDGIKLVACGNADGTYTYKPDTSASAVGAADGTITAQVPDFGTIVVEGAVDGQGNIDRKGVYASGAANGRLRGSDILVEGAMAGKAGASFVNETAWGQGAINGRARAYGYGIEGAATGAIQADLDGNIKGKGVVNGCYFQPNGLRYCYNGSGQYIGYIDGVGQFIQGNVPPTNGGSGGWKPTTNNKNNNNNNNNQSPDGTPGPSSSGSRLEVMSSLAVVLGAVMIL